MLEPGARIRTVIADDEPVARDLLRTLLDRDEELELMAECANGTEALAAVRAHAPDLLLLDVQMPGLDGFEVVEELGDLGLEMPLVIFATAHDQHALRAFEVQAVDFLLKPFDPARLADAIARAKERLRGKAALGMDQRIADLLALLRAAQRPDVSGEGPRHLKRISVPRGNRVEFVDVAEIDWIEAADQYVRIHVGQREHLMRASMSQFERDLDPACFARIHRSAIVALDRVRALETPSEGNARLSLADGTWLPVGRSRLSELKARLG